MNKYTGSNYKALTICQAMGHVVYKHYQVFMLQSNEEGITLISIFYKRKLICEEDTEVTLLSGRAEL